MGMKPKTKAFADKLLSDSKISPTQAYIDTHMTENRATASENASKLLRKANVQIYMKKHVKEANRTAVDVMQEARKRKDSSVWQRLAADQAERIMDRALGKPIQRQQTENTNINLNIEANQEISEAFTAFLKAKRSES